jgi:hypothetical protein
MKSSSVDRDNNYRHYDFVTLRNARFAILRNIITLSSADDPAGCDVIIMVVCLDLSSVARGCKCFALRSRSVNLRHKSALLATNKY